MSARTWQGPSAPQRQRILRETKTVAIVGASKNPSRASYFVNRYLSSTSNYEIFLVNPTVTDIEGTTVYPTLADLPKSPDLVDVFRKYDDLPDVLSEAIAAQAKTIWLQLGLWHEQVVSTAMRALDSRRTPASVVSGLSNKISAGSVRLAPRALATVISGSLLKA